MRTERPDSADLADRMAGRVAAYVHIPFCRRVCPYCDFAVVEGSGLLDRYVDALCAEIDAADPFDEPVVAVAFGGGTPTAVSPRQLTRVLRALDARFGLAPGAEVSVEANPEDVTQALAVDLVESGFTRISLGVQSFDDDVLKSLGRAHSAVEAAAAVRAARAVFQSVNVDLIFGTPGETQASWTATVQQAIDADVDHLSTYSLTVERGTPLSRAVQAGAPAPDPDLQADQWLVAAEMADRAGLVRYEISNHAKPGHEVAYNLITWGQGEYAAFGNGAHRHRGGVRSWNVRRVDRYVERVERGESPVSGREALDEWQRDVERVTIGLRRAAGVTPGWAGACLVASAAGRRLRSAGVLEAGPDRIRLARPLLADEVTRALLALDPADC